MNLRGWYKEQENQPSMAARLKLARKEWKKSKHKAKHKKIARQKHGRNKFYSTPEWKALRYRAFVKYGNSCMCCGISREDGAVIQVDHIKPRHKYQKLALDINNLQILCASCNRGKYSEDESDWRNGAEIHMREITQACPACVVSGGGGYYNLK